MCRLSAPLGKGSGHLKAIQRVVEIVATGGVAIQGFILFEDGLLKQPKQRHKQQQQQQQHQAAGNAKAVTKMVEALREQPKHGRKRSVTNTRVVRELKKASARVLSGATFAQLVAEQLGPEAAVGVGLTTDADAGFYIYGPHAPRLQVCNTGTARRGDFDAIFQLAVADKDHILLAVTLCSPEQGGELEVITLIRLLFTCTQ